MLTVMTKHTLKRLFETPGGKYCYFGKKKKKKTIFPMTAIGRDFFLYMQFILKEYIFWFCTMRTLLTTSVVSAFSPR